MTLVADLPPTAAPHLSGAVKHVVFTLFGRSFALPAAFVAEVTRPLELRSVPGAAATLRGTIPFRGTSLFVLDLPVLLGLNARIPLEKTHVLVVQGKGGGPRRGLLVQRVQGVEAVIRGEITMPPVLAASPAASYLKGITAHLGRPLYLLDIERLLAAAAVRDLGDPPAPGSIPS